MNGNRLVVVSNRLPNLKPDANWKDGALISAGGLVSALLPVMESTRKGLWFGWSGKTSPESKLRGLSKVDHPLVRIVGTYLTDREVASYYNGFCNRTLWPLCHCFQGRIHQRADEFEIYIGVNRRFAEELIGLLEPGDTVWVHDYHLAPLGRYLRRLGFDGPLGYFHHIPFPPREMIEILHDPLEFMEAWLDYDLVGFHTEPYVENYFEVMARLMLGVRDGFDLLAGRRSQRVISCPIGINPEFFDPSRPGTERTTRRRSIQKVLPEGNVIFSVDRLDYTKGIPERLDSFESFLRNCPGWRRKVTLLQICSPSRTRVKEYVEQKAEVDIKVGRINGEFAEHDWVPIRYLYRTYSQADLARFYRDVDVGLVTPLRDGMNLVALEFIAAQRQEAPGVLVLSRFTGAAEYLCEAVLVNPYLPESVAEGLDRALTMPLAERRERYFSLIEHVRRWTASKWAGEFLKDLAKSHREKRAVKKPIEIVTGEGAVAAKPSATKASCKTPALKPA